MRSAFATFGCSHNSCAGELPRSASSHFDIFVLVQSLFFHLDLSTHMLLLQLYSHKSAADKLPFGRELRICIAEAVNKIMPRTLTLN